jgi:hypothetical protein
MASERATAALGVDRATVRDRLWLWGHDAGSHNDGWGLPGPSRITPAEAAFYLGIPNLIMVRYQGRPPLPFDQFAISLQPLRQVVWSLVGAHGQSDEEERSHIPDLAGRHSNVTGVMLDDFFINQPKSGEEVAVLSLDQLRELRRRLVAGGRRLDLWAVLYEHQMDRKLAPFLELLDVVSLWAWDLQKLRNNGHILAPLEALVPSCRKVLGCYMWDYGGKGPMPLDQLQDRCTAGLDWLRKGRIDGIIFLASCICDLELEAVEWTREWIKKIGNQPIDSGLGDRPKTNFERGVT